MDRNDVDEILNKHAKRHMTVWNITGFKRVFKRLYHVIWCSVIDAYIKGKEEGYNRGKEEFMNSHIVLTGAEVQSNLNRVRWAEGLIKQLPIDHDGRNSWLLNYGISDEAIAIRTKNNVKWNNETKSAKTISI